MNQPEPHDSLIRDLQDQRVEAPADLVDNVLAALPPDARSSWSRRWASWWPDPRAWAPPLAVGATLALLLVLAGSFLALHRRLGGEIEVHFVLHAPEANRVELLGDFTGWQRDKLVLEGPDATGHWSASLRLPEGQHEYMFLVDGNEWRTDPNAMFHRPDGYGRENAVIEVQGLDLGS